MSQIRANQMETDHLYVMRTFRRKGGTNYQYDLIRFVARTSDSKLNELKSDDYYYVLVGEVPVKLVPHNGVLSRSLDGRHFRVTFQTEDTATALGLTEIPQTIEEAMSDLAPTIEALKNMPSLEEQKKQAAELKAERWNVEESIIAGTPMADLPDPTPPSELAARYNMKMEGDRFVADEPITPVEPVIPPEPVEPVIPPSSNKRKPLTPEQKARKNALARERRAALKAV